MGSLGFEYQLAKTYFGAQVNTHSAAGRRLPQDAIASIIDYTDAHNYRKILMSNQMESELSRGEQRFRRGQSGES
jgi:hypothetical protein